MLIFSEVEFKNTKILDKYLLICVYFSGQVYVSISSGMALNYASLTLFFELAVEEAYPAPEVVIGGIITASDNFFSFVFLLIYLIPGIGKMKIFYFGS